MPITLTAPVTTPTVTLTLRASMVQGIVPQTSFVQQVHIAHGGRSFVFSPGFVPVQQTVLTLDVRNLFEDDEDGYSGYTSLTNCIITTMQGSVALATLIDADGEGYTVRYLSGLESFREEQKGQWSGQLAFRVEPS